MGDRFDQLRDMVRDKLSCAAHHMHHVERVYALCMRLAEGEKVDLDVLRAAALLHDVERATEDQDTTRKKNHEEMGAEVARSILPNYGFTPTQVEHVAQCILTHRYRRKRIPQTLEAKILFDADKLDGLGAVGIARSFMWAAQDHAQFYRDISVEDYAKENLTGGTIDGKIIDLMKHSPNMEYETKMKHVCEKLYTKKAKNIGKRRMALMVEYFERLAKEIHGEC